MDNGHSMPSIDEMDIMYYFDILIYREEAEELKKIKEYDSMGV